MTIWTPVHQFEIACGIAGAFVDVTAKLLVDEGGLVRSWGRKSAFQDFPGGTFAFTLDNSDGRFTPDTPNAGATALSEGQTVSWSTTNGTVTRLVSGTIAVGGGLQLIFPDPGVPGSARIRVTVGDMLVSAGRRTLGSLAGSMVMGSSPYLYWPLNDPAGSTAATEVSGNSGLPLFSAGPSITTFGVAGVPACGGDTQLMSSQVDLAAQVPYPGVMATPAYLPGSLGFAGVWITPNTLTSGTASVNLKWGGGPQALQVGVNSTGYFVQFWLPLSTFIFLPSVAPAVVGQPAYISAGVTYVNTSGAIYNWALNVYVNGALVATHTNTNIVGIPALSLNFADVVVSGPDSFSFSHLSHTPTLVHEEYAGIGTEAIRLQSIDATTPDVTLGALPGDLSTVPIGAANTAGQSALDAFNDVMRTEQGQLFTTTSGSVGAPVQTVGVRARNRPSAITSAWTANKEIQGSDAQPVRDLSYTVSEVDGVGIGVAATITDVLLKQKVGSANTGFAVINSNTTDVYTAASDRLNRGRKNGFDIPQITINSMSTDMDRSTELLSLTLGDRHQAAGLPATQLGAATKDGWLCGVDEVWTSVTADFTLYMEAAPAATAIYDTSRYMANGDLSLSASLTAGATSMSVATIGAKLSTAETPYTLLIDTEQVTVTACTGATPQAANITRGVNGTTAASHLSGALMDLAISSLYAY